MPGLYRNSKNKYLLKKKNPFITTSGNNIAIQIVEVELSVSVKGGT